MRGRSRYGGAAVLALALLAGCGSGSSGSGGGLPRVAPCPPTCPGSLAPPSSSMPPAPVEGSAAYDALVVEPGADELARGGNDADAGVTQRAFDVVVPAGTRLRSRTVCQGLTSVTLTTVPRSDADSELPCTADAPHELIVQERLPHDAPTPVHVVVTAPAPCRWYAVLSAVPGPPGAGQASR